MHDEYESVTLRNTLIVSVLNGTTNICMCAHNIDMPCAYSYTFVWVSTSVAMHVLHFLNEDIRDLKPPIKFDAGLSPHASVRVPLM